MLSDVSTALPDAHALPLPTEAQRLEAVQALQLLDTPPSSDFDALTRLAALTLDAPIALVSLLDEERAWFKSRVGLDFAQVARDSALCHHTLQAPQGALVVEDLASDPRFPAQPLGPHAPPLRFYAGTALVDASGHALGTLAVLDTQARRWSATAQQQLDDLRVLALSVLDNHRRAVQLRTLALTDALTGLSNRVHFERALEAELGHAMRMDSPFTLLLLDLDGFKAVNDGFGHAAGDEVLREVSQRIRAQLRQGDVLARLGGDEFGIVMRDGSDDAAKALARRIVKAVSQPITLGSGDVVGVGVSIGLAAYSEQISHVRVLLAQADQALYQAKKQNERRWKMFVGLRA
ncbi:MAG: sensor domain-containing diguanylate cyclase [Proteobacteria bacterium]|nr:sensor domain-containing diguanylate cyclase [Pseudomonadota bacterium]